MTKNLFFDKIRQNSTYIRFYNVFGDDMKIMSSLILIVFPIMMYLVFSCYNVLVNKKVEKIFFIVTIFTSLYFSLVNDFGYEEILICCNIPILICYLKKEPMLAIMLSILVIIFGYTKYDINIWIMLGKHLIYLITYLYLVKKKYGMGLFLKISAVVQGFFISFEYFMRTNQGIDKVFELIGYTLLIYFMTFFCIYLFRLADRVTNLYLDMNKVKEENKLKNSLFKLTHEIKNPLAVCKGYLDMINLDDRDKSQRYINIIKSEIDRSLNIMSDFMDYSKIKVKKEIFDMTVLLDELYDSFKILIDDKNIVFDYENSYDEIYLWGDYERLKQVFVNIIKNSIEAIDNKGNIDIIVERNDKIVEVIVQDNGIGMSEDELSNVKTMFYTTKRDGTGLGVSLSNEIVMAHGGDIIYKSMQGEGTECIVNLPL